MNPSNDSAGSSSQIHELLSAFIDRTLTDDEREQLTQLLRDDPQARELYVNVVQLEARLIFAHEPAPRPDELRQTTAPAGLPSKVKSLFSGIMAEIDRTIAVRRYPARFWGAVAVLTLLMWSAWAVWISQTGLQPIAQGPASGEPSTDFCAQLLYSDLAEWGPESELVFDGAFLREGQLLDLRQGRAVIQFDQGANVTLAGPAELIVGHASQCRIPNGKIVASVPPAAVGFVVETPVARVTDLGTEFGLNVQGEESTEVHVFRGRVEVAQIEGEKIKSRSIVRAGEAVKVGGNQGGVSPVEPETSLADISLPVNTTPTGRSIGFNFTRNDAPGFTGQFEASRSPGLVAGTQWNNVGPRGVRQVDRDLTADILSPTPRSIVDSQGNTVPDMTALYSYSNAGGQMTSNLLFQGGLGGNDRFTDIHLKFGGVPFERYDIYVYVSDAPVPRVAAKFTKTVRIGQRAVHFRDAPPAEMKQITSTDSQQPSLGANVAVFRGLGQPSFQVDVLGGISGKAVVQCHGIQIVEISERKEDAPEIESDR